MAPVAGQGGAQGVARPGRQVHPQAIFRAAQEGPLVRGQLLVQIADYAAAHQSVSRFHDVAEEVGTVAKRRQDRMRLECEPQALLQEGGNRGMPPHQLRPVFVQQHEVVHITHVVAALQLVFDELVQLVEIEVGEELAGEVADGEPGVGWGVLQPFVGRYLPVFARRAQADALFRAGLADDAAGNAIAEPGLLQRHAAAADGLLEFVAQQFEQRRLVDAVEEVGDVQLQEPPLAPHPASVALRPASVALHPASVAPHPASVVPHPASVIPHPASVIPHPASVIASRRRSNPFWRWPGDCFAALAMTCPVIARSVQAAHEGLQAVDGEVGAAARAIGGAVVDEVAVHDRLQLRYQPVVHHAVFELGGVDLARLGPLDGKDNGRPGSPALFPQGIPRLHEMVQQPLLVQTSSHRSALAAAAGAVRLLDRPQAQVRRLFTFPRAPTEPDWCCSCCLR